MADSGKKRRPPARKKATDNPEPEENPPAVSQSAPPEDPPSEAGEPVTAETGGTEQPPAEGDAHAAPDRRRPSWLWLVLGGVLAGAVGFGAGYYLADDSSQLAQMRDSILAQGDRLEGLERRLGELASAQSGAARMDDLASLAQEQQQTAATVAEISRSLEQLAQRVTDLENRPIPDAAGGAEAVRAYEQQLEAMREMFRAELDRIEAMQQAAGEAKAAAEVEQERAALQAAFARLVAAGDNGKPFVQELNELRAAGIAVPETLVAAAPDGIVTLAQLQDAFPEFARRALRDAYKAAAKSGETSRFTAFLRTQLGARSLEPREGNDPDAILSRAEAALKAGDLEKALAEISGLPEAGQAAIEPWVEMARRRLAALNDIEALAARLAQ